MTNQEHREAILSRKAALAETVKQVLAPLGIKVAYNISPEELSYDSVLIRVSAEDLENFLPGSVFPVGTEDRGKE